MYTDISNRLNTSDMSWATVATYDLARTQEPAKSYNVGIIIIRLFTRDYETISISISLISSQFRQYITKMYNFCISQLNMNRITHVHHLSTGSSYIFHSFLVSDHSAFLSGLALQHSTDISPILLLKQGN